jgi:hypothetical protein
LIPKQLWQQWPVLPLLPGDAVQAVEVAEFQPVAVFL